MWQGSSDIALSQLHAHTYNKSKLTEEEDFAKEKFENAKEKIILSHFSRKKNFD